MPLSPRLPALIQESMMPANGTVSCDFLFGYGRQRIVCGAGLGHRLPAGLSIRTQETASPARDLDDSRSCPAGNHLDANEYRTVLELAAVHAVCAMGANQRQALVPRVPWGRR